MVRVDDIPLESDEPFGMNGVMTWFRPLLAVCCGLACIACMVMNVRSSEHLDGLRRDAINSQMFVESVFGRLQFQFGPGDPRRTSNADYVPYDRSLVGYDDAWEPSLYKSIGVEWGDGVHYWPGGRRLPTPVWQVRLRWRTLATAFALPPIVLLINLLRRKGRADEFGADGYPEGNAT